MVSISLKRLATDVASVNFGSGRNAITRGKSGSRRAVCAVRGCHRRLVSPAWKVSSVMYFYFLIKVRITITHNTTKTTMPSMYPIQATIRVILLSLRDGSELPVIFLWL